MGAIALSLATCLIAESSDDELFKLFLMWGPLQMLVGIGAIVMGLCGTENEGGKP
jgi:hypothetical protein